MTNKENKFSHLPSGSIAFQGEPGAYSHLACKQVFPDREALPYQTFEDAFAAVSDGTAALAMIPIENSLAGRVADVHHLMPESGLYIVGEYFLRIQHQLMAAPSATLQTIKTIHSHTMALGQCRHVVRELGLKAIVEADTAGSARRVAEVNDASQAAIASSLAAEIYGLNILKQDVEDAPHNTTRFLIMSAEPDDAEPDSGLTVTSFVFRVRNVPAALYKAMGGFATNGVNMTKLESYQLDGSFTATQFYADIEGHPQDRLVRLALEELEFFSSNLKILGIYHADEYRSKS